MTDVPDAQGRGRHRSDGPPPVAVTEPTVVVRRAPPANWVPYLVDDAGRLRRTPLSAAGGVVDAEGVVAQPVLELRREDLPAAGIAVRRAPRLARSHGGARRTWVARQAAQPVRSGGSGLRHDAIVDPEP